MILLDDPISLAEVSRYLHAGRTCIADVYGYRSDLLVLGIDIAEHAPEGVANPPLLLTLQVPDGPLFRTDPKYVRSVTVR